MGNGCCIEYEQCLSCCLRHDAQHAVARSMELAGWDDDVFEYCAQHCRTSSASVVHQNMYASEHRFCFPVDPAERKGRVTMAT